MTETMLWTSLRRMRRNRGAMAGLVLLALFSLGAILAPYIAPYDPQAMHYDVRLLAPGLRFLMGTDEFGRDLFRAMLHGGRVSLLVGFISVSISGVLGTSLGLAAGYFPKLDGIVSRIVDIWLAFPTLLLAIAIVAVLGPGLRNAMIAVGISATPSYIRLVRGVVLGAREREYVEAAQAVGARDALILRRHILPNVAAPIIVLSTLQFGGAILSAASLSFLGLGAQPPTPEWGALVSAGRGFIRQAWWLSLFPGGAIMLVVLALNLLGDGLRDALDPRLK
ncbi:MAG: diguanylate cyclase [Firmicutes bacterium]|nr:diguanylate cyclase [Bacillota bacterium]